MIVQRREFANYLRKNSSVKGDATRTAVWNFDDPKMELNSIGVFDTGTMRYRPSFVTVGRQKNNLYHPVKPLCSTMRETIGRQCHR
jgi:hypothetical protein